MVQSRGGKTGYPARWVTQCVPKRITMGTNGSCIPLRFPRKRTMQSDGQSNNSPSTVGNGNVFHANLQIWMGRSTRSLYYSPYVTQQPERRI